MALNPLAIAHLGFAYRPIVAAMLGLWDDVIDTVIGGGGYGFLPEKKPRRRIDEDILLLSLA